MINSSMKQLLSYHEKPAGSSKMAEKSSNKHQKILLDLFFFSVIEKLLASIEKGQKCNIVHQVWPKSQHNHSSRLADSHKGFPKLTIMEKPSMPAPSVRTRASGSAQRRLLSRNGALWRATANQRA